MGDLSGLFGLDHDLVLDAGFDLGVVAPEPGPEQRRRADDGDQRLAYGAVE
jgi:hypothetical protein